MVSCFGLDDIVIDLLTPTADATGADMAE